MEDRTKIVLIEEEMKQSYLDYSMSVIVGRALPDIKDGLKPVHRRILYAMHQMGMHHNKPFKKCARIVGEVLGKFHPHGDTAVYDSLVRMAQTFSLRYPLINGQGNFGSVDGDNAASMRYTEAKLMKISQELLEDIEKKTVPFKDNFDGSLQEPIVLPAKLPNLLINGSAGIAVGMATNIPPHNLTEVCDASIALINNPELDYIELMKYIKGPDFPTASSICGTMGIKSAYKNGRGKIIVRAKAEVEERRIIVTELPYQVNKSLLIKNIADLVRDKRIEGISNLRDESDRKGMRLVIDLKKDINGEVVLNNLYKHTALQTTFGIIMLALVNGQPRILGLKPVLEEYIKHRINIVTKRTQFDLNKAEERAHILEGLQIALSNIDSVIKLIKSSENAETAKKNLIQSFNLTETQSKSILDMKLQRLTSLEQNKIKDEFEQLKKLIEKLKSLLASDEKIRNILKEELEFLKQTYGNKRKTQIIESFEEIETEDLIEPEQVVITLTNKGYIKRVPLDTYRVQNRGGKGMIATGTRQEDFVVDVFVANTHSYLLIFTDKGKVHWLKAYRIPEGSRYAKGTAIVNLLNFDKDEKVSSCIPIKEFEENKFLFFSTKEGLVKKTPLKDYSRPRAGGIIAINLRDTDELINVKLTDGNKEIILATKDGRAARFHESDVRPVSRNSQGMRGIKVKKSEVIGMEICDGKHVLTITEKGYGKRSEIQDYRLINRGGSGVINIKTTDKNGPVTGIRVVDDNDEIMVITVKGVIIRTSINNISVISRNTQGLRIMRLNEGDKVSGIAKIKAEKEVESEIDLNEDISKDYKFKKQDFTLEAYEND